MLSEQLQGLQTVFTRRFLFNALLPTLAAVSANLAVLAAFTERLGGYTQRWSETDALTRAFIAGAYLATVWLLAVAVAAQWRGIVRLFEGYPAVRLFRRLGIRAPGVAWHQQQLHYVRNVLADGTVAYYTYPRERWMDQVLPTRLGNVLLAAERYPLERYGVDPIFFWPRLYPLLPAQFQRDYEEFVRDYEFPLVVAWLSSASAAIGGLSALATGQSPLAFIAAFTLPAAVGYAAYCFAIPSAIQMGEQQRTAFDLYRGRLLDAWPTVPDVEDEAEAFEHIRKFVVTNAPPKWAAPQDRHRARQHPTIDAEADAPATG